MRNGADIQKRLGRKDREGGEAGKRASLKKRWRSWEEISFEEKAVKLGNERL
jgi:hypothetical protein